MNSSKPIGGYFELSLTDRGSFIHDDAILLNSGRACFEYVLAGQQPTKIYLPRFTCDAMMEPLERTNTPYELYDVTPQLEIRDDISLEDNELIVYTNYFGVRDDYSQEVSRKYGGQLVLDNAQALFTDPLQAGHTFYSPRKFMGVPDGGLLYTTVEPSAELQIGESSGRSIHLLKRRDVGPEAGYEDYKQAEASFSGGPPKAMSSLTKHLLSSIDYGSMRTTRLANYNFLHEHLKERNELQLPDSPAGPLCYPLLANPALRDKLIAEKVFVPQYWPNVLEWAEPGSVEYGLCQNIIAMPIDQRYDTHDMERILEIING